MEYNPSHAYLVVEYYKSNEGLTALEKTYRQHFLDPMEPKFMPKLWDVNHNANRLAIRAIEKRIDKEDLKIAGVDEKFIQNLQPTITVSPGEANNNNDDSIKGECRILDCISIILCNKSNE